MVRVSVDCYNLVTWQTPPRVETIGTEHTLFEVSDYYLEILLTFETAL